MRPLWIMLLVIPVVILAALLVRFNKEQIDRVEVRLESDSAPAWSLTPGTRREEPWLPGSSYAVTSIVEGVPVATGAVLDLGMGLTYRQRTQAKRIEADQRSADRITLTLVNLDLKTGRTTSQEYLRVERRGGVIVFEFPKD